jgi:hypothetical protein
MRRSYLQVEEKFLDLFRGLICKDGTAVGKWSFVVVNYGYSKTY